MKLIDPFAHERLDLPDGDGGGDHAARVGILFQPVEALPQPVRHRCPAARGEAQHLRKTRDRQDAGHQAGA